MLVKTYGYAVYGVSAIKITVEVDVSTGASFFLVGLPDNAVKESQFRIRTALREAGIRIPVKRIVINMAPADVRKEGAAYDLTLALGLLAGSGGIDGSVLERYVAMGELSLDGELKPIKGVLAIVAEAKKDGFEGVILPAGNAGEASVINGIKVIAAENIKDVIRFVADGIVPDIKTSSIDGIQSAENQVSDIDFCDVKGQETVKRAMEIAAAGGHNIILIGPPGAGKTMLARRLPSILPPLSSEEALESTKIHSVAGKTISGQGLMVKRPFRSPHHTVSNVALVGGGTFPQPGEISLAHNGVLFLDELPEFQRAALEVMRQPMEDRVVTISRARFSVDFPASFMLVASMNPCPCGFYNHPWKECLCPPQLRSRYLSRISGPLLDRIDIHLEVVPVEVDKLSSRAESESSAQIMERVISARSIQKARFEKNAAIHNNAQMNSAGIQLFCKLDKSSRDLIKTAMTRLGLSARAYDRILKVSRTIADLDRSQEIKPVHLAEAIQYRSLDKEGWAG